MTLLHLGGRITYRMRPTRFYSNNQEKKVAKAVKGKQVSNSGATDFSKGDVTTDLFLIECKTKVTDSKSITLKKSWFEKNKEEAFAMGKPYSAVVIGFGDGENHYIINENLFKILLKTLEE